MSVIAGVVRFDGAPADADGVRAMLRAVAYRAPDGADVWSDGVAALGVGLFATLPGQTATPAVSADGSVGALDVRLDDPAGLAAALGLPAATPDATLVLAAVGRWGRDTLAHAPGDAAGAVWQPAERRLTLLRDAMGVRPLYVAHRQGQFIAFASEPRALLALPDVAAVACADMEAVATMLAGIVATTATLRRGIERVAPAHSVVVTERGMDAQRYWTLDPGHECAPADAAEGFRDRFDAAVAACLRRCEGTGVGAALSGGLDSSSIAVTARDLLRAGGAAPLPVFSATFAGLPAAVRRRSDERAYVAAVVAEGGVEPHTVEVAGLGPLGDAALRDHLDDIPRTYNVYLHRAMFEAARRRGLRIFLDGTDGDAAVSHGYARLGHLARVGAWDVLGREIAALTAHGVVDPERMLRRWVRPALAALARRGRFRALHHAAATLAAALGTSPRGVFTGHALPALVPDAARAAWRRARGGPPPRTPGFLRRAVVRETGILERLAEQTRSVPGETARQAHVRGLMNPVYTEVLEMADRVAAASGIEMRVPFFDRRLLEFTVALPDSCKLGGGWTRAVLRDAMAARLPPLVQRRPGKADLSPNFLLGLAGPDASRLEDLLAGDLAVAPLVDVGEVRRALGRVLADPLAHVAEAADLFTLAAVEQWLRAPGAAPCADGAHAMRRDSVRLA